MKFKRFATLAVAATMVVGTMTAASAADSYPGFLMFADKTWTWSNFDLNGQGEGEKAGCGEDVTVTGDGTYTAKITKEAFDARGTEYGDADGVTVCCVDISDVATAIGAESEDLGKDATAADKRQLFIDAGVTVSDVTLYADGKEVLSIPNDQLIYGDIESNGKLRIEIWNAYGETGGCDGKTDPLYASPELSASKEISATFTISGLSGDSGSSEDTSDDTSDDASDDTSDDGDVVVVPSNDGATDTTVVAQTGDVAPWAMALAVVAAASVLVVLKKKEVNE